MATGNNNSQSKSQGQKKGGAQKKTASKKENGIVSADDFSKKHPLQSTWVLWVLMHGNSGKNKSWSESLQPMHEFAYVEDFWAMYNHIHSPRSVQGADYSMFKKGVTPAWEDEKCQSGGRWIAKFDKLKARTLDEMWLNLTLSMIGEAFHATGFGDLVCGAVVSSRSKASKVSLWISTRDEKATLAIGRFYRDVLQSCMDRATVVDIAFEDFAKQGYTYTISATG